MREIQEDVAGDLIHRTIIETSSEETKMNEQAIDQLMINIESLSKLHKTLAMTYELIDHDLQLIYPERPDSEDQT